MIEKILLVGTFLFITATVYFTLEAFEKVRKQRQRNAVLARLYRVIYLADKKG